MRLAIYLLFLLSGFVALIYEGIWTRYLKLFLGHSSYGQVITLITFMGGIGLGSFLAAKYLKKVKNPFLTYAVIEILLAVSALIFHSLYGTVTGFFFENAEAFSKVFWVGKAVQVFLCLLITLPFSTLLGLTYPLIAAGLMRHTGDGGRKSLPTLYFINSLGGAAGILVTSYYFIAQFGTNGTLLLAAIGNGIVGCGFYLISKRATTAKVSGEEGSKQHRPDSETVPVETIRLWLLVSLGTGFASFIYEVGWIRLLSLILGSSTHSFDVMISAFIFGLAFGGLFASRLIRKPGANITKTMATVQILMGCFAVISLFLYRPLFEAIRYSHSLIMKSEQAYSLYSIYKYLMALVLMFPASFCAGITLPLITYFLVRKTGNEKYTGSVYGWNTVGSILGAAAGGMMLLPLFQLKWTIFTGAALDIALGVALLLSIRKVSPGLNGYRKLAYGVVAVCVIPAAFVSFDQTLLSRGYYRNGLAGENPPEILAYQDGRTATIAAIETENFLSLKTNGKSDGGIYKVIPEGEKGIRGDESTVAQLAALPMMTREGDYSAAIIGMGTGMTLHYLLSDQRLKEVDLIEIEPAVIKIAEKFRPRNERCFTDERVNFVIDDAKSYFYGNRKTYDIIISEPSNPWVSGVSSLFTKEFYRHTKSFLKPDGVFVQWIHGYEFGDDLMVSVLAALTEFKEFEVYKVHQNTGDFMILASNSPIDVKDVKKLAENSSFQQDIDPFGEKLSNLGPKNFLVSSKTLSAVLEDCHNMANSDYFPYVEQHSEYAFFLKKKVSIFNEYVDSFTRYGDFFDPAREALYRKHCEQAGLTFIETPASRLVRDAIRGAGADSDWGYIESRLIETTGHLFETGKWHENPLVLAFHDALKANDGPMNVLSRIEFLQSVSAGNKAEIRERLTKLLQHNQDSDFRGMRWKRTLTVTISRYGTNDQLADWSRVLKKSKGVSPYEITNLKRAVAIAVQIRQFQNQAVPVSLNE
ncbi:MAG: hypothetical protein P1V20_08220 [Verrucomicrobiales bacterium]|nr:hypothetical protein [Verrucomicrobiales bacterium]